MGIILIALGIVMLYSRIADIQAMDLILNWWPIILVLLGVEILAYIVLSKQEQPKVEFDVFSIVIITFIMIVGVGAYAVTSVIRYARVNTSILSAIDIYSFESRFEKNMAVEPGERDVLKIKNSSGNVEVVKGDSDKIEVKANIIIRNNDEEYAAEISDNIVEVIEKDVIAISSKTNQYSSKNGVIGSIQVNYYIRVPEKINVEIDNKFGDVNVNGILLNASINNSHGEIVADKIGKDLYIDNSFGDIQISNIRAYAKVINSHGKIKACYVGGDLEVKNKMGDIELEEISGNVNVVGEHGKIDIENVEKNVKAENEFGEITLKLPAEQKGCFDIKTEFGSIYSEFEISIKEDINKQTAKDTIGNDDISFTLGNKNGDINIRKF